MLKFPKDFVWGSSTSGPQTEGRVPGDGKGDNLWDYWYQVEPNRYYNGIGPDKTSTFILKGWLSTARYLKPSRPRVFAS